MELSGKNVPARTEPEGLEAELPIRYSGAERRPAGWNRGLLSPYPTIEASCVTLIPPRGILHFQYHYPPANIDERLSEQADRRMGVQPRHPTDGQPISRSPRTVARTFDRTKWLCCFVIASGADLRQPPFVYECLIRFSDSCHCLSRKVCLPLGKPHRPNPRSVIDQPSLREGFHPLIRQEDLQKRSSHSVGRKYPKKVVLRKNLGDKACVINRKFIDDSFARYGASRSDYVTVL